MDLQSILNFEYLDTIGNKISMVYLRLFFTFFNLILDVLTLLIEFNQKIYSQEIL